MHFFLHTILLSSLLIVSDAEFSLFVVPFLKDLYVGVDV